MPTSKKAWAMGLYGLSTDQLWRIAQRRSWPPGWPPAARFSEDELRVVELRALNIVASLAAAAPDEYLAVEAGVIDHNRGRNIWPKDRVPSYEGRARIQLDNGSVWIAVGHPAVFAPDGKGLIDGGIVITQMKGPRCK